MGKTLTLHRCGTHEIAFEIKNYTNGNLEVVVVEAKGDCYEFWSFLTTDLGYKCKPNCAFIATNINPSYFIEWLIENGLGNLTGRIEKIGWCYFPEFEFNIEKLREYTMEE